MKKPYHTIHKKDIQALACFLTKNGHALQPRYSLFNGNRNTTPAAASKVRKLKLSPFPT